MGDTEKPGGYTVASMLMTKEENLQRDMIIHQGDLNNLESKSQALTDNEHHHNGPEDYTAFLTSLFQQGTLPSHNADRSIRWNIFL